MTKQFHHVQPQRPSVKGWVACEPHQATRFAVLRVQKYRSRGRDLTASRVVASFADPGAAQVDASRRNNNHQ